MNKFKKQSLINYLSLKGFNKKNIETMFKIVGYFKDSWATNKYIMATTNFKYCELVCYININNTSVTLSLKNTNDNTKINLFESIINNIQNKDILNIKNECFTIAKMFEKINKD